MIAVKEEEILEYVISGELPYSQDEFQNLHSEAEDVIIQLTAIAIVDVKNAVNKWIQCRALLYKGSQVHIATEKLQCKLKLDGFVLNSTITGLGESKLTMNYRLNLEIRSKTSDFSRSIGALVNKKINSNQPQRYVSVRDWKTPSDIMLADPFFNTPQGIGLLLGVELYAELIRQNQRSLGAVMPILQELSLDWLIMGSIKNVQLHEEVFCGIGSVDLDKQIKEFWQLEEYIPRRRFTIEETKCETLFDGTTIRKIARSILGDSKSLTYKRLISLERRFKNNKDLQSQYITFMMDCEEKGHKIMMAGLEYKTTFLV